MRQETGSMAAYTRVGTGCLLAAFCVLTMCSGCSSLFSDRFLNFVAQPVPGVGGIDPNLTIENAPGHVAIIFINNTQFDPRLLQYFENIGLDTSDPGLRPRVRLRVDILYRNGNTAEFEFMDGSALRETSYVDDNGNTTQLDSAPPRALVEGDLSNVVAMCDIDVVYPTGGITSAGASIEVFEPAILRIYTVTRDNNITTIERVRQDPRFTALQSDEVDGNLNITLQRNFDIRDVPVPATDLQCGSVVAFTLTGTVSVPFINDPFGFEGVVPGYDGTNPVINPASIPGRFEFLTTVR